MPTQRSDATWTGSIGDGSGAMRLGSGAWEGSFNVPSRFADGEGTNPEELLAAAHAGCYSMQLSALLTNEGFEVEEVATTADVTVAKGGGGWSITTIVLDCVAKVAGIDDDAFQAQATKAKETCPVSVALAGPEISLTAKLA